jgi:hypothetical protein
LKIHDVLLISMFSATNSIGLARMPLPSRGGGSKSGYLHRATDNVKNASPQCCDYVAEDAVGWQVRWSVKAVANCFTWGRVQPHFRRTRLA